MKASRSTPAKLLLLVVAMFGFGFALVPLYGLLCDVTGLGGRTGGKAIYDPAQIHVDTTRLVKVSFVTNTNDGMPWKFRSEVAGMRVHPGELNEALFVVRNPTNKTMVAQAVPSLAPGTAAEFFHKTECFCFSRQVLGPGEEKEMPMRFFVAPEIPRSVESISLSYTLFDVTQLASDGLIQSGA
jgi:cytochrome c oxidase assembly protein subunit 11